MHWLGRHRLLILAAISLFWTGLVLLLHFYPDVPFVSAVWSGEKRFEDFLQREGRKTATRDDFVFLGIDQSYVASCRPSNQANWRTTARSSS